MANIYPPSPAPSACDSLADIEDLDAFLEAQGELSRWPTPPPPVADKEQMSVTERAIGADSSTLDNSDDEDELGRLSSAFTVMTTGDPEINPSDLAHVMMFIMRSEVPVEVLAVAYNILRAVTVHGDADEELMDICYSYPDLVVVGAINLAETFMEDKAPDSEYWARRVCKRIWSAYEIEKMVIELLAHPRVRMLSLSSIDAINECLLELRDLTLGTTRPGRRMKVSRGDAVKEAKGQEATEPLKLDITVATQWVNGAVTPAETPVAEKTQTWLRLL